MTFYRVPEHKSFTA